MFGLGAFELLAIFGIALLLFGADKLPALAKAIGKSLGAFKKGMKESEEELKKLSENDTEEKK